MYKLPLANYIPMGTSADTADSVRISGWKFNISAYTSSRNCSGVSCERSNEKSKFGTRVLSMTGCHP